jgi:hypothetical protein
MDTWQRFWGRRDAQFSLGDDGYLADPEGQYGTFLNPHATPVDFLSDVPCLVLLGEPGMGKSYTMAASRQAVSERIAASGDRVLWLDLHEVGSDQQLYRKLFDARDFQEWRDGTGRLHLFLDSFDECRIQINTLPVLLLSELSACDSARLNVRIACRTADWPLGLEDGLRKLFGPDRVDALELLPLRKVDVRIAAHQAGITDVDAFLRALGQADVVPLAIKPTPLRFLVNAFQRDGSLPARQVDLYSDGCRLLCEETDRRLEGGLYPALSARRRLAVAGRIAALTVFGNRAAVWTAVDRGDVPDDDVTIEALAGDFEYDEGAAFAVDAAVVREVLNTGLFSSRGPNRLGWAHQTYAEFLAAHYLVRRGLVLPQIMSLIVHAEDPEGKLVPQLHETAAWLANQRPEVFAAIMQRDPEVLLRSDVASATNEDRSALVGSLLRGYDEGVLLDDDRGLRRRYARLHHPSLAEQLRPYIIDRDKGLVVRRVAIDVAEECRLTELLDELVAVALDPTEPQQVRINAAYAVIRIDDPGNRAKLKPLISVDPHDDPDDQLKGCGLRATWPDFLTASELFAALTPVRGHLVGAYRSFLYNDPSTHLRPADLLLALRWARELLAAHQIPHEFESLVGGILRQAWDHLDEPGVVEEFAQVALLRAQQLEGMFQDYPVDQGGQALAQRDKRLRVAAAAIPYAVDPRDLRLLVWNRVILPGDVEGILERFASADAQTKRGWAELVAAAMSLQNRNVVEVVLAAREKDEVLRAVLAPWFDPISLDSPEAQRAKELHEMEVEFEERRTAEPPSLDPPRAERVRAHLHRFAAGDVDAWWLLHLDLLWENQATSVRNEFDSDITTMPGWIEANAATKAEIVAVAEAYLGLQAPKPAEWVGHYPTITIYRPDWAAFRAFRLLLGQAPERLSALAGDVWARWASVLIAYPTLSTEEAVTAQRYLVAQAYRHEPKAVIDTLLLLIDRADRDGEGYVDGFLQRVADCWDALLGQSLLDHLQSTRFSPRALNHLLEALVVHQVDGAQTLAAELIGKRAQAEERERAVAAAAVLLRHPVAGGWEVVWPAITADEQFGELVLGWIVFDDRHGGGTASQLSEDQLVDAFVWLSNRYPHASDPWPEGMVTFCRAVADWRDDLLRTLQLRGTAGACAAIQRIMQALPQLDWLKWTLHEARRVTRQRTWEPPTVAQIRSLVQSSERRFVQSGEELLHVVLESLGRFQAKLQLREPPLAPYLWDEQAKEPKDEERLSDLLKIHLDEDLLERGIVSNREVTNRRGEETDLRVEAVKYDARGDVDDILTVIIEVKGNWNKDLRTAMRTQLVGRYMASNRSDHGVYVVGWYTWDQWNPDDWRRRSTPKYDITEARRRFQEQATSLSDQHRVVKAVVLDIGMR